MVRVNYPPGGHIKLHSEAAPEPKPVRVLKPSGGGSSISFGDDSPKKPNVTAAATAIATTSETTCPVASTTPMESPVDAHVEAPVEVPFSTVSSTHEETTSNETSQYEKVEVKSENTTVEAVAKLVNETEAKLVIKTHKEEVQNGHTNGKDETISEVSKDVSNSIPLPEPIPTETQSSKSSEASQDSWPSISPSNDTSQSTSSVSPPLSISPPAPTPTSDQPRKIKDHMKSSIFMSDENYIPTRSSRNTAPPSAVDSSSSSNPRQRVPPGGFSTKLW